MSGVDFNDNNSIYEKKLNEYCFKFQDLLIRFSDFEVESLVKLRDIIGKKLGIGMKGDTEHETYLASRLVQNKAELIIDIGANKGKYTSDLLKYFPKADYYLFEPSEFNINLLKEKYENHSNITINQIALSNKSGPAKLYSKTPGDGEASLYQLKHLALEKNKLIENNITKKRFDEYWMERDQSNRKIDFIKIDVEGHELSVLEGIGNYINKTRLIQFEFGPCNITSRTYFKDFYNFFDEKNFILFRRCFPNRVRTKEDGKSKTSVTNLILISQCTSTLEAFQTSTFYALNRNLFKNRIQYL